MWLPLIRRSARGRGRWACVGEEARRPRTGGIDQRARTHLAALTGRVLQRDLPSRVAAPRIDAAGARQDCGAARRGVDGIEHHQARILHPAVRIDEAARVERLERRARRVAAQVDAARSRQHLAPRQMVVQEQAGTDHPDRAHAGVMRHHEAQRPHDVRRIAQQHLALGERLADQGELVVLQIAQPAMDQLGGRRRGVRGEVVLLAQHDAATAPGEITRDAGTVDAAAHDEHVAVDGVGGQLAAGSGGADVVMTKGDGGVRGRSGHRGDVERYRSREVEGSRARPRGSAAQTTGAAAATRANLCPNAGARSS